MSSLFIKIYLFFRDRKLIFFLFLASLLLIIFYFASRIRLEEDLSGMIGKNQKKGGLEDVISHFKFSDKLVIRLSLADSTLPANPKELSHFANDLTDSLSARFDTSYIRSIIGNVENSATLPFLDLLYDHLPLYLDNNDYRQLDSMLGPGTIRSTVEKDYKILQSPAGFALKKMIIRDPIGMTWLALNKLKSLQAGDQFEITDGFIMTKDKRNLLLFITPANPASETIRNQRLLNGIDQLLLQINEHYRNEIKGQYFGVIVYGTGNARQIKKDIFLTVGIAFLLIFSLIGWYFRSWKIPLLGILPAFFGGGFALAILYLIKGSLSTIALGVGSVILGLIVDYALYFINHFRKKGDMVIVLKEMSFTIFICCLTTAGAFLCMSFLRSSALHDLGWFAALSVTGAAFFALVILPQFLNQNDRKSNNRQPNLINRIAAFSFERSIVFIVLLLVMTIASVFFLSRVKFETNMSTMNFVPEKLKETEKDFNRITDQNLNTVYLVSTGRNLNQALISEERNAAPIDELVRSGVIVSVSGCGVLLSSDSVQKVKIRKWREFWTKPRRDLLESNIQSAAGKYGFRKDAFDSFFQLTAKDFNLLDATETLKIRNGLLSDYVSETREYTMITTLVKVNDKDRAKLYAAFRGRTDIVVFDKQLFNELFIENVHHDFNFLVRLSMIFVTLLLIISYGRIETGLTAALPMFMSWMISLGFMGLTGIRFNIFNIIVSSFIFGLGVDYSILMMRGLLFEYKYGVKEIASFKTSITLSSLTTLFGVGALFFALHPALKTIPAISVFGIVVVVLICFTFQPLPIQWFLIRRQSKKQFPVTLWIFFRTITAWGGLLLLGILQITLGGLIFLLFFIPKKKKDYFFHWILCNLCRAYIFCIFPVNKKFINPHRENFSKPAIIIGNHQSLIDIPAFLRLHPKIIILTHSKFNSPVIGSIARMAGFFYNAMGIDENLELLKEKVREGYSILFLPEVNTNNDTEIQAYHENALLLAEKLQIDILPVVIFGSGEFLKAGQFFICPSGLRIKILQRINYGELYQGSPTTERSSGFSELFILEYKQLQAEEGTGRYYRNKLILSYLFKDPTLEWKLRLKMKKENNYQPYNVLLPREGEILVLGCGYGFMSYILSLSSPQRKIMGVDHDQEKIRVASNSFLKNDNLEFICDNITRYSFDFKDAILLIDILHNLTQEHREELLIRCLDNLHPGGIILIRIADSDVKQLHPFKTEVVSETKQPSKTLLIIRK
jgi:uncharacterized protein